MNQTEVCPMWEKRSHRLEKYNPFKYIQEVQVWMHFLRIKEPSQEVIQRSTSHVDIEKEMCDESFKNNNDEVSNDEMMTRRINCLRGLKLSKGPDSERGKHK